MCGIAGLYIKNDALCAELGARLSDMLEQLSSRGPDSAGAAFYRDPAPVGSCKVSLHSPAAEPGWKTLAGELEEAFADASLSGVRATHAVFVVAADAEEVQAWLRTHHPELTQMSAGATIEIYKQAGPPARLRTRLRAGGDRRHPRARAHPDGDRESRHHGALAPVLHRA